MTDTSERRDMPRLRSEFWRSFKASLEPAVEVALGRISSEGYMNVNAGLNCGSLQERPALASSAVV